MILSLVALHGTDARMELVYFLTSVMTVLLPVGVFSYIGYRLFRAYLKEKREAERTEVDASPRRL